MDILGYSPAHVYNIPVLAREFLHFLEQKDVKVIQAVQQKDIAAYHQHIMQRANQRKGGGLSSTHINKHLQAIEKLWEYLHHRGITQLPDLNLRLEPVSRETTVLTTEEVQQLYKATEQDSISPHHNHYNVFNEVLQARDKAMLAIYYSCGLRRNEGVQLHTDDIGFDTAMLHVRKGKNYKERFVPFGKATGKHLQSYIYDHRPKLVKDRKQSRLFLSIGGSATVGATLLLRLQRLQQLTDDPALQQKTIGLHTLRHSIATHLLAAGMSLEQIAKFLGHSSLESTQIYTHLL